MEFKTLLLHREWKGIVLLTLAACFLLFMRGLSARRRHRFLFLTILSLLLIPAAHHWLSSISSKRFQLIQPSVWGEIKGAFQIGSDTLRLTPAIDQAGRGDGSVTAKDPEMIDGDTGFSNPDAVFRTYDLRWDIMWGIGFILLMIRFCWQQCLLARLVRVSPEINDARLKELLDQCVLDVGLNSTPTMIESSFLRVPATWGWFRPVICLPVGTGSWSSEVLITVLKHECSHIKRRDYASLHIAKIIRALTWCNPLSWWAIRRLRTEMEFACDEQVIFRGMSPSNYAQVLLDMAQVASRNSFVAAISMASKSNIQRRIEAVFAKGAGNETRQVRKEYVFIFGFSMLSFFIGCQGGSPSQAVAQESNIQSQLPMYENYSIDAWFFPEFLRQEDALNHWPEIPPREIHAFRAFGEHGVAYLIDRLEGKPLERMRAHEPDYSEFPEKVREEIRGQQASNNRHTAARLLGDLGKDAAAAVPFLEKAANEEDWFIKCGAKVALMKIRNESIDPLLNELTSTLGHPNWYRTAIMVGQFGPQAEKAVPVLLEMLENPETMDAHALDVLGMIGLRPEKSVPALAGFLDHPIRAHRQKAITALMSFGKHNEKVLPTLQSAIKDKDPFVSFRAKWIIGMLNR